MSSMTKKDFNLITDALVEGIVESCMDEFLLHRVIDAINSGGKIQSQHVIDNVRRVFTSQLGNSFAARLRYTNDSFDPVKFNGNLDVLVAAGIRGRREKAAKKTA